MTHYSNTNNPIDFPISPAKPVAWMVYTLDGKSVCVTDNPESHRALPLYTTPPAREWVGLNDKEIHQAFCRIEYETNHDWNDDPESWCKAFYRYVEAKLKEKNNG